MLDGIGLAASAGAIVATAGLTAAALRLRSPLSFLLAIYVLGAGEIVVLGLALSVPKWVNDAGYLAGSAVLLAAAAAGWWRSGRPSPPPLPSLRAGTLRRHPIAAALAAVVAAVGCYELFVAVNAPPNNGDSLTYRMSRTAAWAQREGVHWIEGAHTERQNEFPLNSELQALYTLAFLDSDRVAALPQLAAKIALVLACVGCARRLGYGRAASLFAGLVLGSLTEVALQAVSTQNDLATAAFVMAAAYFVRVPSTASIALAGAAAGLALGTKITAFLALPSLLIIAAASLPRRRLLAAAASVAIGVGLLGSFAYVRNVIHTDRAFGYAREQQGYRPDVTLPGTISTLARITYQFVDLSGFRVRTAWLEPVERASESAFDALGIATDPPESRGFPFSFTINVVAHEDHAFFGPLGFLLVLPLSGAFGVAWALRRTDVAHLGHALALPLFMLGLALAFRFSDEARYLIVPVALTMPLAAAVYRWRAVAAGVAALAALTLVFAHAYNVLKPTGLQAQDPVWTLPRNEAMTLDVPERQPLLDAVDARVARTERLGIVLLPSDWDYPLFGHTFDRRLVPLPGRQPLLEAEHLGLRWVVFGHDRRPQRPGWRGRRFERAGTLLERERRQR
jgi:hypothetical protein